MYNPDEYYDIEKAITAYEDCIDILTCRYIYLLKDYEQFFTLMVLLAKCLKNMTEFMAVYNEMNELDGQTKAESLRNWLMKKEKEEEK